VIVDRSILGSLAPVPTLECLRPTFQGSAQYEFARCPLAAQLGGLPVRDLQATAPPLNLTSCRAKAVKLMVTHDEGERHRSAIPVGCMPMVARIGVPQMPNRHR
jgi:hypothetical protein